MAGDFVSENVDLVYGPELLEHASDVVLVQVARHLAHKHLDGVGVGLLSRGDAPIADCAAIGRRRSETTQGVGCKQVERHSFRGDIPCYAEEDSNEIIWL